MQFDNNGSSIYLQIVDYICDRILLGELQKEDKLPSVRELAVQLEVNPNTVARAYEQLKIQQLVFDKRGIGYFVSPDAAQTARQLRRLEFNERVLPPVFRTLLLLGLEPADLQPAFLQFKNKTQSDGHK
ncbi:MAG: GntR family transcriptional regulator [Bacteroidetes bacterium]|nr:GntR family transcriptional regulator [Bacteroidota bacterium]